MRLVERCGKPLLCRASVCLSFSGKKVEMWLGGENVAKKLDTMKGQIFVSFGQRRDHTFYLSVRHSQVKIFCQSLKKQHETSILETYKINVFIINSKFVDFKHGMRVV